jgi:hypothetical protein
MAPSSLAAPFLQLNSGALGVRLAYPRPGGLAGTQLGRDVLS